MKNDLKTTQTVLRERKTKKKFNFLFQKLREAAAATRPTTPSRPPPGNKLVLDGGEEAAHLGGIHAEECGSNFNRGSKLVACLLQGSTCVPVHGCWGEN